MALAQPCRSDVASRNLKKSGAASAKKLAWSHGPNQPEAPKAGWGQHPEPANSAGPKGTAAGACIHFFFAERPCPRRHEHPSTVTQKRARGCGTPFARKSCMAPRPESPWAMPEAAVGRTRCSPLVNRLNAPGTPPAVTFLLRNGGGPRSMMHDDDSLDRSMPYIDGCVR